MKFYSVRILYGILFGEKQDNALITYSDSDWAGDPNTRRSTSGWICLLNGASIAWQSRKQSSVALSATEAKFRALCSVTKEIVWLRRLLSELHYFQEKPTTVYCDNQAAITLVKNPTSSKRSKHIDTQYYFTCEQRSLQNIDVMYVSTKEQLADPFTKALPKHTLKV